MEEDNSRIIGAIKEIITTTRYTTYQCMRVIELIDKYGWAAVYHFTPKQKKIFDLLLTKLE